MISSICFKTPSSFLNTLFSIVGTTLSTASNNLSTLTPASNLTASAASKPNRLVSKVASSSIPALPKPNLTYFSYSAFKSFWAYLWCPVFEGLLIAETPLAAPAIPKLNKDPSIPNLTLFDNLRNASPLPSFSSIFIIVNA